MPYNILFDNSCYNLTLLLDAYLFSKESSCKDLYENSNGNHITNLETIRL